MQVQISSNMVNKSDWKLNNADCNIFVSTSNVSVCSGAHHDEGTLWDNESDDAGAGTM